MHASVGTHQETEKWRDGGGKKAVAYKRKYSRECKRTCLRVAMLFLMSDSALLFISI